MYKNIATQRLCNALHKSNGLEVDVLRLDLIDPDISGNKWFKLKYFIEKANLQGKKGLVSFGGPYSNHLVALAVACRKKGLSSVGLIRGEEENISNHSLRQMDSEGMKLIFVSREAYRDKEKLATDFLSGNNDFYLVPEGGQSEEGIRGAQEILQHAPGAYSHIFCSAGTGTTLAGIINSSDENQEVIGISALKISNEQDNKLKSYLDENTTRKNFQLQYKYHFGGYAKKTDEMIRFMNSFFLLEGIPTDFVYTGKMFYAVSDMIQNDYFVAGSKLLLIHTGGLQGNRSLPPGTLVF